MDVNGTRFHLVFGKQDWFGRPPAGSLPSLPIPATLEWNDSDATIQLKRQVFLFGRRKSEAPPTLDDRRGIANDRFGNFFWISTDRQEIRFLGAGQTVSEHFWAGGDSPQSCQPQSPNGAFVACMPAPPSGAVLSGLAVTGDQYLLVGISNPGGLLGFDLYAGGPPLTLLWPASVAFDPFEITAAPDCGAVILDRTNRRLWRLDGQLRVAVFGGSVTVNAPAPDFQPLDTNEPPPPPVSPFAAISPDFAISIAGVVEPVAAGVLPDGSVLVLDNDPALADSGVHRYAGGVHSGPVVLERPGGGAAPELRAQDMAIGSGDPPPVYVVDTSGNQAFIYRYQATGAGFALTLDPTYLPMREYGGKGLIGGSTISYDLNNGRMAPLVSQPRPRYVESGSLLLPPAGDPASTDPAAFDGREPDCIWHRIYLDAVIPPGTSVLVESRAANQKRLLKGLPWQAEPRPALRSEGAELPFYNPALCALAGGAGTFELLFQRAVGRYLQLRVTLFGTGRASPRIQALRLYYPRFSYLRRYLPAAYREDPQSASFLDRYLANTEEFLTVLEGRIEHVEGFFDTRTIGSPYLDWLASWMGVSLDVSWSESTKRLFLANADRMFRERGTKPGLTRSLRLALDPCVNQSLFTGCAEADTRFPVRIVENFQTRMAPGVVFGDPSDLDGPGSTSASSDWTPALGAAPLDRQFRAWLAGQYATVDALNTNWGTGYSGFDDPTLVLPAVRPPGKQGADWAAFIRGSLGFTYAHVTLDDEPLYRQFLISRYRQPSALNAAYGLTGAEALTSFAEERSKIWDALLTKRLPEGGVALSDWIQFVSIVVPEERSAHTFTVLVPVTLNDLPQEEARRRDLARRVAEIAKPAHTTFNVKLYWAMLRVGEARLGLETVVGPGSRSVGLVLSGEYLGAGNLNYTANWAAPRRTVVARDRVALDSPPSILRG